MLVVSPTPLILWLGILAMLATLVLSFTIWKRSPHPSRTALVEILRILCVALVVLLLCKAEWRTILHPSSRPAIAILHDESASMSTADARLGPPFSDSPSVVSRAEWVDKALTSPLWTPLENQGSNQLITLGFSAPDPANPSTSGTDLEFPIDELLRKQDNLRAVILLSDGDHNIGQPPVVAAQKLRLRDIPLFAIPVGSESRLPDLDLLSVSAPTYGIVGENIQIPFTIRSSLDHPVRTIVRLRDDSGRERVKDITLAPNAETYDSILWKLEKEGSSALNLSIPVAPGELIPGNNARKFTLSGKPERIRVLVVDTLPRWEYRFLRNALSRDPGVELSCLLLHPDLGPGGGRHYISEFPEQPSDLATFDVIFIGDIGVGPNQLTEEQCELIRGLVENQASGVVFLPGPLGNQRTLLDTGLSDLMPVVLDEAHADGFAEPTPSPLTLTTEGRGSLLTMLGNSEEENPAIWRHLPGFFWHAPVIKAKAGAEVLATHGNRRGKFGPIPLLVTKTAGSGKVLYMGIDSAWRWRAGVEDLYHYRFWGQVARWMSYQRNMAAGQRIRLYFNPERPAPGDTVTIHANAFDPNGAPLKEGTVLLDITSPGGEANRVTMTKNDNAWGTYSGRFKIDRPGPWKIAASIAEAPDKPLETTILAQGVSVEKVGQPARPEVLAEMARITRGRIVLPDQIADLTRDITALPTPSPRETRVPLWSNWISLTLLISLLTAFWIARKLNGAF